MDETWYFTDENVLVNCNKLTDSWLKSDSLIAYVDYLVSCV